MSDSILTEAHELINGERAESYGPVGENWSRTVQIFNAWTGHTLSPVEGLKFMVAVKLARETHRHKADNLRDAAGYLGLIETLVEGE